MPGSELENVGSLLIQTLGSLERRVEDLRGDHQRRWELDDTRFKALEIELAGVKTQIGAVLTQVTTQNGNVARLRREFDEHAIAHQAAALEAAKAQGQQLGLSMAALTKRQWSFVVGAIGFIGLVAGTAGAVIGGIVAVSG